MAMAECRAMPGMPLKGDSRAAAAVAMNAAETGRLLAIDPGAAERRAREILADNPENRGALLLLGAALRRQGNFSAAKTVLESLVTLQPDMILAYFELGLAYGGLGAHGEAVRILERAIDLKPEFAGAWYAVAEQLQLGRICEGAKTHDGMKDALDVLGAGRHAEGEAMLARRLEREPNCEATWFLFCIAQLAQEKGREALPSIEKLASAHDGNTLYRDLRAAAYFQVGDFSEAIAQYEAILKEHPARPGAWMAYGRALRALGRQEQCVHAFKKAIELLPGWAEACRTLASVKTYRFKPDEIDDLRAQLGRSDLPAMSYAELHYALGKALEDAGQFDESFDNYRKSAALQRASISYSAELSTKFLQRELALFTAGFLHDRSGMGCPSAAPIFVVGMPRAGSTLVQEILCAHSDVERTGELRYLTWMAARLDNEKFTAPAAARYPEVLRTLDSKRLAALGEEYLQRTLPNREVGRPFFVDKYPGNFTKIGLIHLILPHAKIIDVRRHPLDCCLSCFKHYFPEGLPFSHSLDDLGRYYADYVHLMAHFDAVLPGKIHRVFYETLVQEPEKEVQRLLGYLNLPFEDGCLRYYESEQAVMTSSAEQVRGPIYKTGIGGWRNYKKWIDPLRQALGPVLETYPAVPRSYSPLRMSMSMRLT